MLDSMENTISVQFSWITTFDVEELLKGCVSKYPTSGAAGWMAKRWVRMLKNASTSDAFHMRPRKLRLLVSFRYDPPWRTIGAIANLKRAFAILMSGNVLVSTQMRRTEYTGYANQFRGLMEGKVQKLADLGFRPRRVNGQALINTLYPLLNRRSIKSGKFKRNRTTSIPVPVYDPHELLANQVSDTPVEHPKNGVIKKDGRYMRSVSMVHNPKQCLPLMISPMLSSPYENILSVTFSKDTRDKQLKKLDNLDSTLGFRERTGMGRTNQKVQHQAEKLQVRGQEVLDEQKARLAALVETESQKTQAALR